MTQVKSFSAGSYGRRHACGGFTITELLVVMGLMVFIGGAAIGIMDQSERAARTMMRRQDALQYCELAIAAASADLRNALSNDQFVTTGGEAMAPPLFDGTELSMATMLRDQEGHAVRVSIRTIPKNTHNPAYIERRVEPIGALPQTGPSVMTSSDIGGVLPAGFGATIQFAYAAASQATGPVAFGGWHDKGLPALVQISVRATLDSDPKHPIELQTCVVPGLQQSRPPADAEALRMGMPGLQPGMIPPTGPPPGYKPQSTSATQSLGPPPARGGLPGLAPAATPASMPGAAITPAPPPSPAPPAPGAIPRSAS